MSRTTFIGGKRARRNYYRVDRAALLESLETRRLLSTIPLPTIPSGVFNVTTYGAIANASTDNTVSIQNAINAASNAGGGTVEIPAAAQAYECGPLTLKNSINFQIDTGATLQMLPYGTYPLVSGATSYADLLTASNVHDVEVTGGGSIDGQGSPWWTAQNAGQIPVRRPAMIGFSTVSTVAVTGITMTNSPSGHLTFSFTNSNITVNGITISTPNGSPNTDGIDCTGNNVIIENSSIADGDDNIAFGGRNSSNLTVTNCTFGTGHGLSIGSFTDSGGLNGLTVTDCYFNGTLSGPHGKSYRGRGGLVQNLSYSNIVMTGVTYPFNFDSYYTSPHPTDPSVDPGQAVTSETPFWNNVSFTNIYSTNATYPVYFWGLLEAPLTNFSFSGVTSTGSSAGIIYHANQATGAAVTITNSIFAPTYNTYDAKIAVTGGGPSIATQASAGSLNVASMPLSVLGADPAGESGLTYTWIPVGNLPAPVTFSANGTNAAKATTATFSKSGTYVFQVVVTDAAGLTTTSAVTVTPSLVPVLTSIKVTPSPATMVPAATQQFTAVAYDQFGNPLATQPSLNWTANTGTISSTGSYTAPIADATATITATSGSTSGTANVTVAVPGTVVLTVNPALPVTATNFQTIQSAISSVPTGNTTPYDIQIAPGTYSERLTIALGQDFITLDGGTGSVTVQAGSDQLTTPVVTAAANNLTIEHITLNDNAGQTGPNSALLSTGDRQLYLSDSILGYQDTLFANKSFARQYFQNCTISGSVDFIYGAATCVFNACTIIQRVGGVSLTAPATPQAAAYGLVFINSHLVNGGNISSGTSALARAWTSPYGAAAYIDTNMDNMISATGWTNFSATTSYVSTERYDEYGSYGAGAAGYLATPSQRASQAVSLTATQAAQYANLTTWVPNFANLFNGWNPTAVGGTTPVVYVGSNGVWETATNWNTNLVPSAGQAIFVKSGTVTLASTTSIDSLTLGTSAGGATFTIPAAGTLTVGGQISTAGTSGTPTIINDAGSLTTRAVTIGNTSDQLHIQNNATFAVTQSWLGTWPSGKLYVDKGVLSAPSIGGYAAGPIIYTGNIAGSTGTWNMPIGAIAYPQSFSSGAGTSVINITGGIIYGTYGPQLGSSGSGGTATINLSAGQLDVFNPNLGASAGTYVVNQTGGIFQKDLVNSAGSTGFDWLLGDASGAVSTWNLSGATSVVSIRDLYEGRSGTGVFNQTGGAVTIYQEDSTQVSTHSGLRLGWAANGSGVYSISGGSLAINNGGITLGYDPASGTSYGVGTLKIFGASAGPINVTGNYSQSSHSVLEDHVQATGVSTIDITGNVSFAAGAMVNPVIDAGGAAGSYTVMTWTGTATGTPTLSAQAAQLGWSVAIQGSSLVVTKVNPAWLAPESLAAWSASTHALTVLGATSIIADPGTDEPIIQANGSADQITLNQTSGSQMHIGGLSLTNGSTATVTALPSPRSHTNYGVVVVGSGTTSPTFSIDSTSTLNLTNNDMIVVNGSLSAVFNQVTHGFNGGNWSGLGITSSSAKSDISRLTALGVVQNNQDGTALYNSSNQFDGVSPGAADILVRYTYYGDANLDGKVDGSDYSLIDYAFSKHLTGWLNGDFNYDGIVDGSDYSLIDNAFNGQGASLAAAIQSSIASLVTSQPKKAALKSSTTPHADPFTTNHSTDDSQDAAAGAGGSFFDWYADSASRRTHGRNASSILFAAATNSG